MSTKDEIDYEDAGRANPSALAISDYDVISESPTRYGCGTYVRLQSLAIRAHKTVQQLENVNRHIHQLSR